MKRLLGISAFYHDSAAALVVDGKIVAAAEEERFTRKKHDPSFPSNAVAYCLEAGGVLSQDLNVIAFYDQPFLKLDRLLKTYLAYAPKGFRSFQQAVPTLFKDKLCLKRILRHYLGHVADAKFFFAEHHQSHAASAFYPSPFESAAILTIDGVGEWSTSTIGHGEGNKIRLLRELRFPHSLGLLYSAFTSYCGFRVNSGEYKLMGLAPYGRPEFANLILTRLLDLKRDGSFRMNMNYFDYCHGLAMTNERFHQLFGGPPRQPECALLQRHMDLAASIQFVTEEIVLRMASEAQRLTGEKNLALAGGVALNCVANGRVLREGAFSEMWIQPAAGDSGGALGAALLAWYELLGNSRTPVQGDSQKGSLLGPEFSNQQIEQLLQEKRIHHEVYSEEEVLLQKVADLLAEGKIVGWFHGRMEFGPRALGARSILADPRNYGLQSVLNMKIKYRESFRPFAPAVLKERASEFFDLPPNVESPYMLVVAKIPDKDRLPLSEGELETMTSDPDLRRRLNVLRTEHPAITHVDYSARLQTVDEKRHGRFYRLLRAFEKKTRCPMLVNTSFNVRGEPIVCSPLEALECFLRTEMDTLVLENFLLRKEAMQSTPSESERAEHLANFAQD